MNKVELERDYKWWTEKDVQGNDVMFYDTATTFSWRDWKKSQ